MKRVLAGIGGFGVLALFASALALGVNDTGALKALAIGCSVVFALVAAWIGACLLMYALSGVKL